jgi:hypothetical protein
MTFMENSYATAKEVLKKGPVITGIDASVVTGNPSEKLNLG